MTDTQPGAAVDRVQLTRLLDRERTRYLETHPRSAHAYQTAKEHLVGGVPMTWMQKAAGRYERASRFTAGVRDVIEQAGLPWSVVQLGARTEYRFASPPPRTGTASAAASDPELEDYLHVLMANRGVLMTPFHNMALMCPATSDEDVDRHTELFGEAVAALGST
jgi:glutamate-1-semialdehyde aminotransferase